MRYAHNLYHLDHNHKQINYLQRDLILEIIALSDVYEALSPKLSMDSERLYQLPTRIESIKNILAALDFRGNLTEQKQAVKLLEEIAAIEQEKDETTKQKREKEFVEKVLYSNNSDSLLMYIRNKNEDFIKIKERMMENHHSFFINYLTSTVSM